MEEEIIYAVDKNESDIHQLFAALPGSRKEHSMRVAKAAAYFFGAVVQKELYEEELALYTPREVERAVLYHDIGYLLTPGIFNETGVSCDWEQTDVIKRHTIQGAGVIERYRLSHTFTARENAVWRLAAEAAIGHHERWDGKGYPHGEMATAISLVSRITSIVNYCDVLVREDEKKRFTQPDAVLKELEKRAGTQFDPRLIDRFEEICGTPEGVDGLFPSAAPCDGFRISGRGGRINERVD